MSSEQFSSGDRVRHAGRPEWGIGTIVKVEGLPLNGHPTQRLSVRFPNAGVKTIVTGGHAELQRVDESADPFTANENSSVKVWDKMNESEWLAPMAKRKVEETLISLPADVRDPFNSMSKRLNLMLSLYRFDRTGRGLIDWAVAQTGLDDPLSRFTRQDLEQKFDRWAYERDTYLSKLLQEVRNAGNGSTEQTVLNGALKSAPQAAQDIVRRLTAGR